MFLLDCILCCIGCLEIPFVALLLRLFWGLWLCLFAWFKTYVVDFCRVDCLAGNFGLC